MYSVLRAAQDDLISIVSDLRLYRKPAYYGIFMPLSGSFVDVLRTEGLEDLLRGLEFVSEDYAGRTKMALGCTLFDTNWDQVYKDFENTNDKFMLYEYATGCVHGGDAFEACYASEPRVYYRSFRA